MAIVFSVKSQQFRFVALSNLQLVLADVEPQTHSQVHEFVLVLYKVDVTSSLLKRRINLSGSFIKPAIYSSGPI